MRLLVAFLAGAAAAVAGLYLRCWRSLRGRRQSPVGDDQVRFGLGE